MRPAFTLRAILAPSVKSTLYLIWWIGRIVDHKRGRASAAKEQPHREVGTQSHGPRLREVAGLPSLSRRVRAILLGILRGCTLRSASDEDGNPAGYASSDQCKGLALLLGGELLGADG